MGSDSNRQIIAEDPIGTWPNAYTGGVDSFVTTQVAGQTVVYDLLGGAGGGDIITCTTSLEASTALTEENDGKLIYYTGTTESPWTNGHLYLVQAGSSPIEVVTLTVTASNTYTSTTESYSGTYNLVDASATGADRVWTNGNFNIKYDSSNSYWYITPVTGTESYRFTNATSSTSIPSGSWTRIAEMLGSLSNTYTTSSSIEMNAVDLMAGGSGGASDVIVCADNSAMTAACTADNVGKVCFYTGETNSSYTKGHHYLLKSSESLSATSDDSRIAGTYEKNGDTHTYNNEVYEDWVNGSGTVLFRNTSGAISLNGTTNWGTYQGNTMVVQSGAPTISSASDWPGALSGLTLTFYREMQSDLTATFTYTASGAELVDLDEGSSMEGVVTVDSGSSVSTISVAIVNELPANPQNGVLYFVPVTAIQNLDTSDGISASIVTSLPASPDADTLYFVTGSN